MDQQVYYIQAKILQRVYWFFTQGKSLFYERNQILVTTMINFMNISSCFLLSFKLVYEHGHEIHKRNLLMLATIHQANLGKRNFIIDNLDNLPEQIELDEFFKNSLIIVFTGLSISIIILIVELARVFWSILSQA